MKVALIQMNSQDDKAANVKKALHCVEEALARRAEFILLPEYFTFRGPLKTAQDIAAVAERIPGPSSRPFMELARKNKTYILLGTLYEKIRGCARAYNTSVLIGPRGEVRAVYRKQNLFHANVAGREMREGDVFEPGRQARPVSVGEFAMGMTVCFDVRFPEPFQNYARKGSNLFVVPSAFAYQTGKAHWEVLLRARAIETLSYVLAPNQTGPNEQGVPCWGHSMAVDPWGKVIAEASTEKEEIVYCDIDINKIKRWRKVFPGLGISTLLKNIKKH